MSSSPLSMKSSVFSLGFFCVLLISHFTMMNHLVLASSDTCDFPAIFNFGDGNSDTGAFSSAFAGLHPFYGRTFFNGQSRIIRGSDGRLIIDFLATSLGKPFLHPYLNPFGANFSYGANFANILATIAPPKLILPVAIPPRILPVAIPPRAFSPFFLDIQYDQFRLFMNESQRIRKQGGEFKKVMPKMEAFSKALYTIDIGQNDLTQALFINTSILDIKVSIPDMINRISKNIQNIYNLGGRTFWIHNTSPLGCFPYILTMMPISEDQMDNAGCSEPHNNLAQYFNSMLKKGVNQLRKDLPLAAITYVDIYSAVYNIFQEPQKYGFKLPLQACCGYGGKYDFGINTLCESIVTVNGTQIVVKPCQRPSERLSWDGIQYTDAANKVVFDMISTGEFSDPPNPLKMACHKMS